jgi:hypothetical protein
MEESLRGQVLELHDGKAAVWYNENMERQNYPVRKTTLHEADDLHDEYYASLSPQECLAIVWPITQFGPSPNMFGSSAASLLILD